MTHPVFTTITKRTAAVLTVPLLLLAGCAAQGTTSATPAASAPSSAASTYTPSPSPTPSATPSYNVDGALEAVKIALCNLYDPDDDAADWAENDCDSVADQLDVQFRPSKKDFEITVKVREKKCFGSAGCNVTYRIDPEYVGDDDFPDTGETEVMYAIKGAEEPIENYFTVDSEGSASVDFEETASTASSSDKLTAVVTDVSYSEE